MLKKTALRRIQEEYEVERSTRYTVDNPRFKRGMRYDAPGDSGEFSDEYLWKFNRAVFTKQAINELLDKRKAETQTETPEPPISLFGRFGRALRGRPNEVQIDPVPSESELQGSGPILLGANLYQDQSIQDLYDNKKELFPDRTYDGRILWRILHEGDVDEAQLTDYMKDAYPGFGPEDSFNNTTPVETVTK